ncbi:MAG: DegT/DnrJ/EryC1/StrS family aminotransferase [Vulcanimicrobiaceae bacterium]
MIPHNRPTLGAAETAAATSALESGYVARGPQVRALEAELCEWLGLAEGCAALVSSGTAALYLALHALGAAGCRVALPAYACAALRNAVAMIGASAQMFDCAPQSPNIDVDAVAQSECEFAIVPNMYGIPADVGPLETKMTVIDDAAQSIGAAVNGRQSGLSGRAGIFSFYATKLMTTGGMGGAVVSRDRSLIAHVQDYLDFDCRRDEVARFNFQLGDLQAAVGRAQLRQLHGFLQRRQEIFSAYVAAGLDLLGNGASEKHAPVRYRAVARTPRPAELMSALEMRGVQTIVPTQSWELPRGTFANAMHLAETTVSLPIYPSLTQDELRTILQSLAAA